MPALVEAVDVLVFVFQVFAIFANAAGAPAAPSTNAKFVIRAVHQQSGLAPRYTRDVARVLIYQPVEPLVRKTYLRAYGLSLWVDHLVIVVCLRKPRGQIAVL